MRITKACLRQIIKEEIKNSLNEESVTPTRIVSPRDRARQRSQRPAAGTTAKINMEKVMQAIRPLDNHDRALSIAKTLFPGQADIELEQLVGERSPEGDLADKLFGFLFPAESNGRANPLLLDLAEDWISTQDNPALEIKGYGQKDKFEDLSAYLDSSVWQRGAKDKAHWATNRVEYAHLKALDHVLNFARKNPQHKKLPPHQHFTGVDHERYAQLLIRTFPEVYRDFYEKELEP